MMWAFDNWSDFLNMGGYAVYVWSAVGITAIVFIAQVAYTLKQHKKSIAQIRRGI